MSLFHSTPERKIRYAIVGLGWISQEALMPGVEHTGNSVISALVTGDPEKATALAQKYGVTRTTDYAGYGDLLKSGEIDAVYLALPNTLHREYAVQALDAGIHLLLEKPMAPSEADCRVIIDAAARTQVKLMIAYRLHFEAATLAALDIVHSGRIGEPRLFNATFSQQVAAGNHRTRAALWAGPVPDMGPYPINAARQLFRAEPTEAFAWSARSPEARFAEVEETVSVMLRFPGDRLASFMLCYGGGGVNVYRIVGSKGDLAVEPGFTFGAGGLGHRLTIDGKTQEKSFAASDQFGGELKYFSDCILNDRAPEPDGEEGLADVRVCLAIEEALRSGRPQTIAPLERRARPTADQLQTLKPISPPKMVNAKRPEEGGGRPGPHDVRPKGSTMRQPSFFIPHGGGPCFFMDDPRGTWTDMAAFLRTLPTTLPERPRAVLVVSGHWETDGFALTGAGRPPLIYDYGGFPPHTYQLRYDAPGAPDLAARAAGLLGEAGLPAAIDPARGLDHGVFVPLKVMLPDADIPVIEMSVDRRLDPALHLAAGRALAPLRDEGVLILGSGMSFHNMRGYRDPRFTAPSQAFDAWLTEAAGKTGPSRAEALTAWETAPAARLSHPYAEHLLPLMVAAGAAEGAGAHAYSEIVMETAISGYRFD